MVEGVFMTALSKLFRANEYFAIFRDNYKEMA